MPEAGRDLSQRLTSLPGLANPAEAGGAGWLAQQSLPQRKLGRSPLPRDYDPANDIDK